MPTVFLPVEAHKQRCQSCDNKGNLLLCSRCGETTYCSADCQKKNWTFHKESCKKTDRLDLDSFYPVFAGVAEAVRMKVPDPHVAILHKIINAPNPKTPASVLPNGHCARVVQLGEPVNMFQIRPDQSHWWPRGETPNVRGKLAGRIAREGRVLPIVVGTCIAIMLKIYCSPNIATPVTTRLRYKSSSLFDFGVVCGKAHVSPDDQLAYVLPDGTIQRGQDPNKHYWIYFETQKSETVYLDCSLFTFNVCLGCAPAPYLPPDYVRALSPFVPACFWDRTLRRDIRIPALTEQRRISFLRDETLRGALESIDLYPNDITDIPPSVTVVFRNIMGRVKGRPDISREDFGMMMQTIIQGVKLIGYTLANGRWKSFPARPQVSFEDDPGE